MTNSSKWILARKSHLKYYDDIPLYYKAPSGKITLYKPAGMSISDKSLKNKFSISEFYIHPDNRLSSIEAAHQGFNQELKKKIVDEDLIDFKQSLVSIVEETLAAPRAGSFKKVPQTVNMLIEGFSNSPSIIDSFTKLSFSDYTTALHSVNVFALTLGYCFHLSLPKRKTQVLAIAALLHDVGKTEIPQYLLKSSRRLTDEEFAIMETHTTKGYEILKGYNENIFLKAATGALEHHEKLDGSGYPKKKTKISYIGKVLSIIDCYEALTNDDRPYRTALKPMDALSFIKKEVDEDRIDKKIFRDFAYSLVHENN